MLLSVFHFYYLGILRLAILLLRIFHRMAHTWKYGARNIKKGHHESMHYICTVTIIVLASCTGVRLVFLFSIVIITTQPTGGIYGIYLSI